VAWDKLAEICNQYLNKGTRVYIEGRLQTRKWTDKEGVERYATEIIAHEMIILSEKRGGYDEDDGDDAPAPATRRNQPRPLDNEVPF
jgi:single-strand DNA-binding protein